MTTSDRFDDAYMEPLQRGLMMALATVLLTILLEALSFRTVQDLLSQPKGRRLYTKAVIFNLVNHFILGVPIYVLSEQLFCKQGDDGKEGAVITLDSVIRVLVIVLLHSVGYYLAHMAMHTVPGMYKFHSFHHRFKDHIPPSSANAVSPFEYVVAYILPFAVGAGITRPRSLELQMAVGIVSVFNLLVHMPAMEACSRYFGPAIVSATSHKEHHRLLTSNYAAPTFNIDWISKQVFCLAQGVGDALKGSKVNKKE